MFFNETLVVTTGGGGGGGGLVTPEYEEPPHPTSARAAVSDSRIRIQIPSRVVVWMLTTPDDSFAHGVGQSGARDLLDYCCATVGVSRRPTLDSRRAPFISPAPGRRSPGLLPGSASGVPPRGSSRRRACTRSRSPTAAPRTSRRR